MFERRPSSCCAVALAAAALALFTGVGNAATPCNAAVMAAHRAVIACQADCRRGAPPPESPFGGLSKEKRLSLPRDKLLDLVVEQGDFCLSRRCVAERLTFFAAEASCTTLSPAEKLCLAASEKAEDLDTEVEFRDHAVELLRRVYTAEKARSDELVAQGTIARRCADAFPTGWVKGVGRLPITYVVDGKKVVRIFSQFDCSVFEERMRAELAPQLREHGEAFKLLVKSVAELEARLESARDQRAKLLNPPGCARPQ